MNDEAWQQVTDYVTTLQNMLGLALWEILILHTPPEAAGSIDDPLMIDAQTEIADEGRHAKMRLHPDFADGDRETQRLTITHELLHLHTDWPISDLLDDVKTLATDREHRLIEHRSGQSYERMNDALAQAIAPLLPLPPWETLRSDDADTNPPSA